MGRLVQRDLVAGDQDGFVLVWAATSLVILLGFAGVAVDLGNWYLTAQREQRAADAAALAAAAWLPDNPPKALTVATETMAQHGYVANVTTTVTPQPVPGKIGLMNVKVETVAKTSFLKLLGVGDVKIKRQSTGFYHQPLPMGSPGNVLGREFPDPNNPPWQDAVFASNNAGFWPTVSGQQTHKQWGFRWSTRLCAYQDGDSDRWGTATWPVDHCDTSASPNNVEYQPNGVQFVVKVPPGTTSPVAVQIFDPITTPLGGNCDGSSNTPRARTDWGNQASLSALAGSDPIWASRYEIGTGNNSSPFCAGDTFGDYANLGNLNTRFKLWTPNTSAGGSTTICNQAWGTELGGGDISAELLSNVAFRSVFHKWVPLCTINPAVTGTGNYIVTVETNNVEGINGFGIRAGIMSGATVDAFASRNVKVYAAGRLQLLVNDLPTSGVPSKFYVAKVRPEYAGQTVDIDVFDLGDTNLSNMSVHPPVESGLLQFSNCEIKLPGGNFNSVSPCDFTTMASGYDAQVGTLRIPMPAGYTCDPTLPTGCWITLDLTYSGGSVDDQTSWSAGEPGEFVRLVKD